MSENAAWVEARRTVRESHTQYQYGLLWALGRVAGGRMILVNNFRNINHYKEWKRGCLPTDVPRPLVFFILQGTS